MAQRNTGQNTAAQNITNTRKTSGSIANTQNTTIHDYTIKLSENKLYAWQRAYKQSGLDGLLDSRGYVREGSNKIKELGLESLVNHIIEAQSGCINIANVHDMLHLHLHIQGIHDYTDYKLKTLNISATC